MKNILLLALVMLTTNLQAQLEAISLHNRYNPDSSTYTVVLIVEEGQAIDLIHRTQFNCQVSIVTPAEGSVEILESHNPLQNNFEAGTGTTPATWSISSMILAPGIATESNFFSVVVQLAPTSRHNELAAGDCVELFTYRVSDCTEDCARLYRNSEDPVASDTGMGNTDFSNGFTAGSPAQLFNGISDGAACLLSAIDDEVTDLRLYPNPATDYIVLPLLSGTTTVHITGVDGQVVMSETVNSAASQHIDVSGLSAGSYFVTLRTGDQLRRQLFTKL